MSFKTACSILTLTLILHLTADLAGPIVSYNKSGNSHITHFLNQSFSPFLSIQSHRLGINEGLDVAQPPHVLALLLDVHIVGHEDGQGLGDASLLEESLHQDLEILVEAAEGRAGVDVGALLGGLGVLDLSDLGVIVVEEVLDDDIAVLGGGVDVQGARALAGLLNHDGQVDGGSSLLVHLLKIIFHLLLGLGGAGTATGLDVGLLVVVLDGIVLKTLLLEGGLLAVGVVVGDIGNREADGDPGLG